MLHSLLTRDFAIGLLIGLILIGANYVLLKQLVQGLLHSSSRLRLLAIAVLKLIVIGATVGIFLKLGTVYTWGLCAATTIFIAILIGSSLWRGQVSS